MKIPVDTVGMMAAHMASQVDEDTWNDIYDRGGYILHGISVQELALRKIARAAVNLAKAVEYELEAEQEEKKS